MNPELDEETSISRVSPWKNKDEFTRVYNWLFADDSNQQTKQQALQRMKIWKIRRLNLTPATVLSTFAIIDVQLKDVNLLAAPPSSAKYTDDDLRQMYSEALTKFLNHMSSIMRSRTVQSMYSTARELGIESFLVDLRHLCAHGQVSPSLEILRRTATYCVNWLREFYWDRELRVITDASVRDVQLKSSIDLEESIRYWFHMYDAAAGALAFGYRTVDDLLYTETRQNDAVLEDECTTMLREFAEETHQKKLSFIANKAINSLAELTTSKRRDHGHNDIFCDVLFDCKYFVRQSAAVFDQNDRQKFVGIHQNLFRLFAICDFINNLFHRMLIICEDDMETIDLRKTASFWANEIATGFTVFKEFKQFYKNKKEKRTNFEIDMAPINTDIMTEDIKQIYKKLGVDFKATLIFGDTVRRPWSLHFDRNYLMERALNLNEYTVGVIRKCIHLAQPSLHQNEIRQIENIISIYVNDSANMSVSSNSPADSSVVYTLNDIIQSATDNEVDEEETTSIWREAPDGIDWKSCPLGTLPWATN